MHPVLFDRKRLALYLLLWGLIATLLALLVLEPGGSTVADAVLLTLPPTLIYAFVCLAAWYPVRAMPLRTARIGPMLATHFFGALVLSGAWLILFRGWALVLAESEIVTARTPVLLVTGALLYLLAVAAHYLLIAVEDAHRIERRAMEVEMLAREAELKVLKAQLDPHFLFNALNSVSSLCGSNPASARTLTTLLADYLRKSLRLGGVQTVTLSEELELASGYLAIERIRFGARLEVEQAIEEGVRAFLVPPLLLQPLVENAVTHGIGHLLEGGTVRIAAARDGERVRITVENPCDPDRPSRPGASIGLANTRRRIETYYGPAARLDVTEEPSRYRVALSLPG